MAPSRLVLLLALAGFRLNAAGWQEDFSSDPAIRGWKVFGDPTLFAWNPSTHSLDATWNTEQTNSFFHRPLGTILAKNDDFTVGFDLRLDSVEAVALPGKQYAFEIAVGLLNITQATATNFFRGDGSSSPNLVEFDYFPDTGYSDTVSPTVVSSNSVFRPAFIFPYELVPGDWHRIVMRYSASNETLLVTVTNLTTLAGTDKPVILGPSFGDFRVDTVAVSSYADRTTNGHLLVHGAIDNFNITLPDPPVMNLTGRFVASEWQAGFLSRTNWLYSLHRSTNFITWSTVSNSTNGTGGNLVLADSNASAGSAFYRVRAERP